MTFAFSSRGLWTRFLFQDAASSKYVQIWLGRWERKRISSSYPQMTYKSEKNKLQRSPQLNIPPNRNLISLFKLHQGKEMENQTKVKIQTRTETSQTRDRFHLVKILRILLTFLFLGLSPSVDFIQFGHMAQSVESNFWEACCSVKLGIGIRCKWIKLSLWKMPEFNFYEIDHWQRCAI